MGAYNYGDPNPYIEGQRRPIPPSGPTCDCSVVQLSPRFLRPLVRRLVRVKTIFVSEQSLHPEVNRLATSLLRLEETKSEYRTQVGIVLRVSFTGLQRRADDLESDLRVSIDNGEVFAGRLRVLGAYARGKVTFAHTVVGAVEMLYLHLLEMAVRNESSGALRLGVLHIDGSISNPGVIQDAVTRILKQNQQQQDDQCIQGPGFDAGPAYGLFPAAGFGYFSGFQGKLVDPPPEKGSPGTAR
jgi:hypothetical protein